MQNLLPLLCTLACPVGMGLLMWLLMRNGKEQTPSDAASTQVDRPIVVSKTTTPSKAPMSPVAPSPLKAIWDCVQMCLNWKVLVVLAVVAVVVGVVAPQLLWGAIPTLLVLACPLSMIVMMFSLGRRRGTAGGDAMSCCLPQSPEPSQEQEQADGERSSASPMKW